MNVSADFWNQSADRTVFYQNGRVISLAEYRQDVARYAAYFSKQKAKDIILYIRENTYLFFVCFMALMQAEKQVILPAVLKEGQLNFLAPLAQNIFTNQEIKAGRFIVEKLPLEVPKSDWHFKEIAQNKITFFTSGSTSEPKPITKTMQTLLAEVENIMQAQKAVWRQKPVLTSSVVPHHIYGMLWWFLLPLCAELAADLDTVIVPEELQQKQKNYPAVAFISTPAFMDKLIKYQAQYTFEKNCVAIYSSGSLLVEKTSSAMRELLGVSPFEIFGSTETGGVAWRQQKNGAEWQLFPPVEVQAQEKTLMVTSPFVMSVPYQMNDAVEMKTKRTFLLKGRSDRLIKIADKRISLPEMESCFAAHPFVEKSYVLAVAQNPTRLGAVLTLSTAGKTFVKAHTKKELVSTLNTHLKRSFEETCIPKKYRFVHEIPTNPQGKFLAGNILPLFETKVSEPVVENVCQNAQECTCDLTFLPDAAYFQGHFTEQPILPGVAQTYFAAYLAKLFYRVDLNGYNLSKLKFAHLILPNQTVRFTLKKIENAQYAFSYFLQDKMCSTGIFVPREG